MLSLNVDTMQAVLSASLAVCAESSSDKKGDNMERRAETANPYETRNELFMIRCSETNPSLRKSTKKCNQRRGTPHIRNCLLLYLTELF